MDGGATESNHDGGGRKLPKPPPDDVVVVDRELAKAVFKDETNDPSGNWAHSARMIAAGKTAMEPAPPASISDVSLSCRVPKAPEQVPVLRNAKNIVKQILLIDQNAVIGSH